MNAGRVPRLFRRWAPNILLILSGFLGGSYYTDGLQEDVDWLKTVINIVTASFHDA